MVSVIVPVYNTEPYLKRCIESILHQSVQDCELILVDDGSGDGSAGICDRYADKYENVTVIHNENRGPAASRACGVAAAKGAWIMFVDSDDWLHPDMLKVMLEQQRESGASMVTCIYTDVDDKGREQDQKTFQEPYIDCLTSEDCMRHMHQTRYLSGSPCTKLFLKELFSGIDFCSGVTIGEDYAMVVQLAQKAGRVRMLSRSLYYRYVRRGSISHAGYTERHKKAFDNYMSIRLDLISKYPSLRGDIIAFHTEYEMAVITAMCRNDRYDKEVIMKLKADLRANIKNTLGNAQIPLYMKCCAVLIAYAHPVFIFWFRILYRFTGR